MTADVSYTMRLNSETKELLQRLQAESGETQSEFYKRIATQLELEQLKNDGISVEAIDELQIHTSRINEIMINLLGSSSSMKTMFNQQMQDREHELMSKIDSQAAELERLAKEKEFAETENKNNLGNYYEVSVQLHDTKLALDRTDDLITEYKDKIRELSVLAAGNQLKASECDALTIRVKELEAQFEISEDARVRAEDIAREAKAEVKTVAEETKKKIADMALTLDQAKAQASEYKASFEQGEREKVMAIREAAAQTREAVAQAREEYLGRLEAYQAKQNEYVDEIQQLRLELSSQKATAKE